MSYQNKYTLSPAREELNVFSLLFVIGCSMM